MKSIHFARDDDVLVLMGDGWNARHRGPRWGEEEEYMNGELEYAIDRPA